MPYRYRVLVLLFLLSVITYLDRVCISVAGPRMQSELGLSPYLWGWVVGAFTLSYALFEIPSGAMADRIGARKVLSRIVLWWSAFTALTGMMSNFWALLAVRFAFGAGEAGAYPGSNSSISRWFPTTQRALGMSVVWAASRIGGAISPLLVVPIQQAYGWRACFYLFGAVGVVWVVIWYLWYRDHPWQKSGVTADEIKLIGSGTAAEVHHGLPWARALRNSNFWIILVMYHTYCWGSYFYLSWLHTFLQKGRGMAEDEMKIYSALPFLGGMLGNLVGGASSDFLSRRIGLLWGRRIVGSAGLMLSGIFMLGTALLPGKMTAAILLTLGYFSMDCMLPVAWAVCIDVGKKYSGALSGSMNMAGQLGSFLSALAFGKIVEMTGNYNTPLIPFSMSLMVSALLFLRIDPTRQLEPEQGVRDLPKAA